MSSSPLDGREPDVDAAAIAERLCGAAVTGVAPCGGGGNNRVYRVDTVHGAYALKSYGPAALDERDRLGHEFDGLSFLNAAGIGSSVPAAVAVDRDARCALYEWIEGQPPLDHGAGEISQALAFLAALNRARLLHAATALPMATEAVLCFADLIAQIERRYERLMAVASDEPQLRQFLADELRPELERRLGALGTQLRDVPLDAVRRTLSPSDFGFHNALRQTDGSLVFIDFEYFGWDDPVKLSADFLWHPAMTLSAAERAQFTSGAAELYGEDQGFSDRLSLSFPLYGLRWALIVLNEFLPQLWARRAFAGKGADWGSAKRQQLSKARTILAAVHSYREGHVA